MTKASWDLFISHASEDKEEIVKPLAEALAGFGARVWYDEFTLELGDSISRSIDKGLASSNYGLVVLSKAFFQKDWTEYELRGLVAKELGREKVILPIWHDIKRDEVLKFSPSLADKFALKTEDFAPISMALKILEIVRPDILTKIHRRVAYIERLKSGDLKMVETKKLMIAPPRHKELPKNLIGRIRVVRAVLLSVYPHSMDFWTDGFKRDAYPTGEVSWWERLSSSYLEYILMTSLDKEQHKAVFNIIFGLMNRAKKEDLAEDIQKLPDGEFEKIRDICMYELPTYEIEDDKFGEGMNEVPAEALKELPDWDIEEFP